uniref:Uncharacterized protein TCIL3000_4_2790 n=1 Tax=Trypanosoma congolense (strain IL3000) TaxID=1068625 RepID=G0ULD1_TRYCI|nr:unnamed protein product [Trypanosoma congolense IL3000]
MHASPQLCELFCVSVTNDGVSTRLVSCVTRCFQAIDESVSTFFSHGGGHISSILWFIRVVFDLLMVISQRHTLQLTHANALLHCTSMKLWEAGGRIVLGHVKYATDPSLSAVENMEPFKEVIRIVLLYTVRWFNAVLSALDNSQAALAPIADFVFAHQLLFQSMLVSPTTSAQRRYIDTPALELYNEISGVLLRLASSPLVNKCQPLVHLFSLTELLDILTRSEFINMPIFLEDSVPTPAASSTFVANQRASLPSAYQQQQIAAATQHVVIFIFLTENLAPFLHGHGEENIAVGRHQSSAPHKQSHLRYDAGSRLLITRIMENVLVIIERLCNSNIVSAATAVPYFISVHCLVLLLHAFLIVDRMLPVTKVTDGSHWSHIVHALEEARRVMNGWKVLHSDYRKGVQVRRTGDHWSVAAPSVSNQSMHAAPATITAAADEERPPLLHSSTAAGSGAAGRAPLIPVEVASGLLPSSPATGNLTTIGALVGFVGSGAAVSEKEPAALRGAVDQVLVLESLLRRVKVAVSNALREASRP